MGGAGLKACAPFIVVIAAAACRTVGTAFPAVPTGSAPSAGPARPAPSVRPALPALAALQRDIDAILAAPRLERAYWGVLVKSLVTGDTIYAVNARKLMMPASNMKIVTLAAAAERLGWDYTYTTTVLAAGAVADGTLHGDLLVVGSGDPSLMASDDSAALVFAGWADGLKARGIRSIAGRIVGGDHALDRQGLGFGWSWDDLPDDYAAAVGALQLNENAVRVTVAPGPAVGDAAAVSAAPAGGLTIASFVTTGSPGSAPSISKHRLPGSMRLELRGAIPLGGGPVVESVAVDDPTLFFVTALRSALVANGIDVRGPAVDVDDLIDPPSPAGAATVGEHRSAPLSTLAVRLMKSSQNQYAETLLKTVGLAAGTPTAAGGRSVVRGVLDGWGVNAGDLIQRDGSGLSRYDYVSPEALVAVLSHVDGNATLREPFEASLPVAGRDGTLANRMKGTGAEGNVRAKTGSMSNVRAVSGYLTATDGERLVFSILANNFETTADVINAATDAIIVRLVSFSRR
jgi:D-alanyl-D-alanine carboxypeptidase/D-alanyl-D-alanine-endopeptidase (penicillin-binding protein 4)